MEHESQKIPRRSTGVVGMNFSSDLLVQNSVKSAGSSSNLSNLGSQFNFSNLPGVALALAQQQQQQQQAALLQLFQNQQQNNLFNLTSPAAALNYLSMLSSPANQNGKQWKNS